MRLDLVQNMRQEMSMRLAPQIIQSIEILQLPLTELLQEVKDQLENNPLLEEVTQTESEANGSDSSLDESERKGDERRETTDEFAERIEGMYEQYDNLYDSAPRRRETGGEDKKHEAMLNTAARSQSLQDYVFEQFMLLDADDDTKKIGEAIIFNLNDEGYLQYTLEEVVAEFDEEISVEQAEEVLKMVQGLDPSGIGARDLRECLLLQLGTSEAYAFERMLVCEHLEDLQKNKLPKICKDTSRSMDEIKEALHLIGQLDPSPGTQVSNAQPQYIIPDIVVEEIDDEYVVIMEDRMIPRLEINKRYREILSNRQGDKEAREFVRAKLEAAKWLIDSIQQRKRTIHRVAEAIVRHQQDFFEEGLQALRPLKMQETADELGIHVSTVSRAVGGKYMQTPRGVFALKYFFSGGMSKTDDLGFDAGTTSTLSVQQRVQDLIDIEDKKKPMSDDDVMNTLKEEGIEIARRTVTKYRKALGIPSSRQRREY